MTYRGCVIAVLVTMLAAWQVVPASAQSLTSGDLAGTITDPSGAVLPNASGTLKNNENGGTQTRTTGPQGAYRFSPLNPGNYTVSVSATGFQAVQKPETVTVGQTATINMQ
jgi:hypothetical protein